jgi:hypothetical protein
MFKNALLSLAVFGPLMAASAPASAQLQLQLGPLQVQLGVEQAQLSCLDQNAAQAALRAGNLLNVTAAAQRNGITGQIVSPSFCTLNGVYVWVFSEVGRDGVVRRYVVNATTGAVVPGA